MANILVLEDDPEFGALLCASLEDAGHSATLRRDASSAQNAFEAEKYDLVIADILVKKNGVPVPEGGILLTSRLSRLAKERGLRLPIIAISGHTTHVGMQDVLAYARTSGAWEALTKPFEPDEVLSLIDQLLRTEAVPRTAVGSPPPAPAD